MSPRKESEIKKSLKKVELENEELLEKIINQKQEYSAVLNHLRLCLTNTENSLMKSKLEHVNLAMEKDIMNMKFMEVMR